MAILGVPRATPAQTLFTVAAGPSLGGRKPVVANPGVDFQASVGHQRESAGTNWRLDAFVTVFEANRTTLVGCGVVPPSSCPPFVSQITDIGVAGLAASELLGARMSGRSVYALAGLEADWLFMHASALRLGASTGLGIALATEAHLPALVVEARYHYLINAPGAQTWFVPVTLGIRF